MSNEIKQNISETGCGTPACDVQSYSYRYPDSLRWTLRDVNFSVKPGTILAVMGKTGSGKTTLLSSLVGLNHSFYRGGTHEGSIRLFGKDVAATDIQTLAADFGLVFQDFRNQLFADTVESSIAYPLENTGVPYGEMTDRVGAMLDLLNIRHLKTRDVQHLSGGEGQATVIASMLVKNPRLMIFDDITADLDPAKQQDTREIMLMLREHGMTQIIVDASAPEWLLSHADTVAVLGDGGLQYIGPPAAVLKDRALQDLAGISKRNIKFQERSSGPFIIEARGLDFGYNGRLAVENITFGIREQSVTGIIGHNGSGKTTLLKIMAGLLRNYDGDMILKGRSPAGLRPKEMVQLASYVPQETGMFFTGSVTDELAFTPKAIGRQANVTPASIGLGDFAASHPAVLSRGYSQMLAVGCALTATADILLLDEPTKGLDATKQQELKDLIMRLRKDGKTVVIVSHDLRVIGDVATDVIVMDHGKIRSSGPAKEVLTDRMLFERIGMPLPW